ARARARRGADAASQAARADGDSRAIARRGCAARPLSAGAKPLPALARGWARARHAVARHERRPRGGDRRGLDNGARGHRDLRCAAQAKGRSLNIAFVGGGNMASALIGGLLAKGTQPASISVIERYESAREKLARQ